MKNHIEISLEWKTSQVDLAVPENVMPGRLIELISQAFDLKGQKLPEKWRFMVKGKNIDLNVGQTLKDLGIGNGAILQLIVEEGEKNEMF